MFNLANIGIKEEKSVSAKFEKNGLQFKTFEGFAVPKSTHSTV